MVLPEEPLTGLGDWRVARQLACGSSGAGVSRPAGPPEPSGFCWPVGVGGWEGCGQQGSSAELEPGAQPGRCRARRGQCSVVTI